MNEQNEAAGAAPGQPQPDGPQEQHAAQQGEAPGGGQQPPEPDLFDAAGQAALGGTGLGGGSGAARAARRTFTIGGDNQYYEGNVFLSQQFLAGGGGPAVVDGLVPQEELDRLAEVYQEPAGYGRMKRLLRDRRLLVLSGEPGSGRTATALALLSELDAVGRVQRLDPDSTRLQSLTGEAVQPGTGYVFEPGTSAGDPEALTGLHLDRFAALLTEAGSYGVVIVATGDLPDRLLRGRYATQCAPPPAEGVLRRHLRALLRDTEDAGDLDAALAHARGRAVREALGLGELRPAEAAQLAAHLADHRRGALTDDELLGACRLFVREQAREWFAGADAPGTVPEALPALSTAAFRTAVAVFNGSAYSVTAEAAEQLAWEFSVTLDPQHPPGRRLFGAHSDNRPATARAVVEKGEVDLGTEQVPGRVIRLQGSGLATAVLHEVWHGHHNARGPVARWLRTLCDDPRPQMWVRASLAAGVLCSWDWVHGYDELVAPMAGDDSPGLQMAAATVLAQAARDPEVRPVVSGLLAEWSAGPSGRRPGAARNFRTTAVFAHGYGLAAGSVSASLDELGKIARRGGTGVLPEVSHSVLRLLAGSSPGTVVGRLGDWLRDGRREYRDLVLLTVVGALSTRTTLLWGLEDVPELEAYAGWPCAAALAATRPHQVRRLGDLVRHALASARSGEAALAATEGWMRQAAGDEEQLTVLCGFLPLLVGDVRDAERLRDLLERLVRDVDEPLDKTAARRMWDAVESEMEQ